ARMTAVEAQVQELAKDVRRARQDAAAARLLAGEADRDVTEIRAEIRDFRRATTASFNVMREDFTDLRNDFTGLRNHVDNGFIEIRGRLDAAAAGQQQIVTLLNRLIDQHDGQASDQ